MLCFIQVIHAKVADVLEIRHAMLRAGSWMVSGMVMRLLLVCVCAHVRALEEVGTEIMETRHTSESSTAINIFRSATFGSSASGIVPLLAVFDTSADRHSKDVSPNMCIRRAPADNGIYICRLEVANLPCSCWRLIGAVNTAPHLLMGPDFITVLLKSSMFENIKSMLMITRHRGVRRPMIITGFGRYHVIEPCGLTRTILRVRCRIR